MGGNAGVEGVKEFEVAEEHARAQCCVVRVFGEDGLRLGGCVSSDGFECGCVVCDEEVTDGVVVLHALSEV